MKTYGQRQYRQTQVTTVDKGRLIILLYDGAIKFLNQAKDCTDCGDIPGRSSNINRALDIIAELNQSLNMSDGGEIAENLRRLYLFWSDHLIQAKMKKDCRNIDEVIRMLMSLNEAWNEVVSSPEAQEAMPKEERKSMRGQVTV